MRFPNRWAVGRWTFFEVERADGTFYAFSVDDAMDDRGLPKIGELYLSLDHAMVAAVGEKYTGERGAGGSGVGTAADWFMRMIGAGQISEAGYAESNKVLTDALSATERENGPLYRRARAFREYLEKHGVILARPVIK